MKGKIGMYTEERTKQEMSNKTKARTIVIGRERNTCRNVIVTQ